MEGLIEELIRWLGYAVLRIVTLGRYAGGTSNDHLREIALGLVLIALVTYVGLSLSMSSG
jgi:hypothetical protein